MRSAVFEKPPVDAIARACITRQHCDGRVAVIAGDMFRDAWPEDFDAHLLSNVLHDWDEPTVRALLAKSHDALAPGGLLIIHDAFINAEKTGPLHVAEYSALLMQITEGKCYSLGELRGFLNEAGFEFLEHKPTSVSRGYMVFRRQD